MKNTLLLLLITCFTISIQAQPGSLLSAKKIGASNGFQFFDTIADIRQFGRSVCFLGDLNKDGVNDIAVGAIGGSPIGGYVYILFLDSNGGVKSHTRITKNESGLNTASPNTFTEFGQSIANLGDLDGDGIVDIAVGNKGSGFGGEVYILFLNSDGTVKNHSRIASNVGGFNTSIVTDQNFSKSIANIGDINGDGVIDIVVGNQLDNDGGNNKGAVYVLFLNSNGVVKKHQKISVLSGGFSDTIFYDGWFGSSVCSFDKNRFFVGSTKGQSSNLAGAIWLLSVDTNGIVQNSKKFADTTFGFNDSIQLSDFFGSSLANIGDLDGDSIKEIAIGADGYNDINTRTGAVFIMSLDVNNNIKFLKRYSNSVGNLPFTFQEEARFGSSISSIGDFNKDKKLDLIVGSQGEVSTTNSPQKGRLNLLFLDGIEHDLSISKLSTNSRSISVYPNPAYSKIKLALKGITIQQASVQITDISGKTCLRIQNFNLENEIDVSLLKAGVYFVRLQTSEGIFQSKLIVQ